MGSTFYSQQHSPKTYEAEKLEVIRVYSNDGKNEILAISKVSNVWYLAVRTKETNEVWAGVCLTYRQNGEWGYKAMSEGSLPYYFDANWKLLSMLSPTEDENSLKWRKTCYEVIEEKKAAKKKVATITNGMILDVTGCFGKAAGVDLKTFVVQDVDKRQFYCQDNGVTYTLRKSQIETIAKKMGIKNA